MVVHCCLVKSRPSPRLRVSFLAWSLPFVQALSPTPLFVYLATGPQTIYGTPWTRDVLPHCFSLTALPLPPPPSPSPIHPSRPSANANFFGKHSLMPFSQSLLPTSLLQSCHLYQSLPWLFAQLSAPLDCKLLRTGTVSYLPSDSQSLADSLTYTSYSVSINGYNHPLKFRASDEDFHGTMTFSCPDILARFLLKQNG